MLVTGRRAHGPACGQRRFDIDVGRAAALAPAPGVGRAEARGTVGATSQAGHRPRADRIGGRIAGIHAVGFLARLRAEGDVDRRGQRADRQRIDDIRVEVLLFLREAAEVERGGAVRPERGIDRVAQRVVDAVAPVGAAYIPAPAFAPVAAQTEHALQVVLFVAVFRAEAGRVQAARIPAGEHTTAVVDRGSAIGIAPVEIADALAVPVQTEAVEVDAVVQGQVEVEAEMAVFQVRLTPALHRIGHDQIRVGVLEGDRIGALAAARGRIGFVPVGEQRQAALVAQGEAVAAADLATGPIAFAVFGHAQ
ncbi:hypothetical protein D3C71_1263670 [compost metagenome]